MIKAQPLWTIANLTDIACKAAHEMDDYSLVGLAARIRNPVVLAALRESVVLYAEMEYLIEEPPSVEYAWEVDGELAAQARRFVDTFNALFDENLPSPEPDHAERFWEANQENDILGRCVRLGCDDNHTPFRYYHWAICIGEEGLTVQEFWHPDVWTTTRYREALKDNARCPDL